MSKKLILVGTFHFEQHEDILQKKKQEIEQLVDFLAEYHPTKIALEWESSSEDELNTAYLHSDGQYTKDEIQQIGFRLAKKQQHDHVYAVNDAGKITQGELDELMATVQNSYPQILKQINAYQDKVANLHQDVEIMESYRCLQAPNRLKELERMYLSFVIVENKNEEKIGVQFLQKWMERELLIFKRVVELSSEADDEGPILLLVGSDHLWMLGKLFEGKGWKVINPFAPELTKPVH
ncbi:DUF5694 domain-containing protein [Mesobacillus maritimus]|uniref:DUF5694 domain-containing protein n=1 Tax=Mesobacillus maritimus TaxID=1643336 RepID=UPI00203C57A3|nr:DUF5694 domain-containing protein [Mesobacillus maritimus]MCM3670601.1 DUF5694 domain-containing protein [Mesobacillus maritimus]